MTLTANGADLPYERIADSEGFTLNFTLPEETGDLKLILTNNTAEESTVYAGG